MSKVYQITKEQCQGQIDKADGVCPGCGGKVTPIETVNNSDEPTYWSGCETCSVFCYPVPSELYKTAQALLDEGEYCYKRKPYEASDEEMQYWRRNESRGLVSRVAQYVAAYKANS